MMFVFVFTVCVRHFLGFTKVKVILIVCICARRSGSEARVGVGGTQHAAKSTLKHALNIDCETDFANVVDMCVHAKRCRDAIRYHRCCAY